MDYKVNFGDTLWGIATEHGAQSVQDIQKYINDIAKLNGISNTSLIFEGTNLRLPGDTVDFSTQTTLGQKANLEEAHTQESYDLGSTDLGKILNEKEGKEYSSENSKNSRTILRNNGFDLSGFEEKQGENGHVFFERKNEDGSVEYVRVVSYTDPQTGEKSTRILNSVQKPGENSATGKIYNADGDTSIGKAFENWATDGQNITDSKMQALIDVTSRIESGELSQAEVDTLSAQLNQAYTDAMSALGSFNFVRDGVEIQNEGGIVYLDKYIQETTNFARELLNNWDKDGEEGLKFEEYLGEDTSQMTEDMVDFMKKNFNSMDLDKDGTISVNELAGNIRGLDNLDGNEDGKISFEAYQIAADKTNEINASAKDFVNKIEQFGIET